MIVRYPFAEFELPDQYRFQPVAVFHLGRCQALSPLSSPEPLCGNEFNRAWCDTTGGRDLSVNATSFQRSPGGGVDAYVARISPNGTVVEAVTYLGGGGDFCQDLRLDGSANVYAFGTTTSRSFPVTRGVFQTAAATNGSLFVTSLDSTLGALRWSTLSGSGCPSYDFRSEWKPASLRACERSHFPAPRRVRTLARRVALLCNAA